MATTAKTRRTRKTTTTKAGTSRAKTTAKATGKGKTQPADGPSKRELLAEQNAAHTERIVELREAETSWSEIAEELKITPGKAQYLMMCYLVSEGEVPAITGRNDAELVKRVAAARAKADEHSSWGWLSAHTSIPETRLKAMMEEEGTYAKNAENIAAVRAEAKGTGTKKGNAPAKGKPATTKAATSAAKKTTTSNAKATAAKKRAARAAGKAKTS